MKRVSDAFSKSNLPGQSDPESPFWHTHQYFPDEILGFVAVTECDVSLGYEHTVFREKECVE